MTSYYSISHHHLADHLIYLSSSSSYWFSLNSSYDHEFHLSKRLGMSPQDYEYLLMALDLASIHKRWGFSIKVMKWKVFLEGYLFSTINCDGTFEVDTKKMVVVVIVVVVVVVVVVVSRRRRPSRRHHDRRLRCPSRRRHRRRRHRHRPSP